MFREGLGGAIMLIGAKINYNHYLILCSLHQIFFFIKILR